MNCCYQHNIGEWSQETHAMKTNTDSTSRDIPCSGSGDFRDWIVADGQGFASD